MGFDVNKLKWTREPNLKASIDLISVESSCI